MAKLKSKYQAQEEIPEPYRDLFEQRQGEWILTQIEGLKTDADVHRLQRTNEELREANKTLKTKVESFGDKKPEDIETLIHEHEDMKAQLEAGGKVDEGKVKELVDQRVRREIGKVERERDQAIKERDDANGQVESLSGTIQSTKIRDALRAAALDTKNPIRPEAMPDVLMYERSFTVDEEGKVVTKEGCGFTPGLEPPSWLTDMQPVRTHWWEESKGGGAGGGSHKKGSGKNPWTQTEEDWNMEEQGKILKEDPTRARALALEAGAPPPLES